MPWTASGRRLRLAFAGTLVALLVTSYGAEAGASADALQIPKASRSLGQQSTARTFWDDYSADLISSRRHLWLVVSGARKSSRQLRLKSFVRQGRRWKLLPPIHTQLDTGETVQAAVFRGRPCVGYSPQGRSARVRCLRHGVWRRLPSISGHPGSLADLRGTPDGRLVALYERPAGSSTRIKIVSIGAGGEMISARTIPRAIVRLGENGDNPEETNVAVADQDAESRRFVLALHDAGWSRTTPDLTEGFGPQIGGSVTLQGLTVFPVNDATARPWQFSLFGSHEGGGWSELGGGPLSRGRGNAQGGIQLLGSEIWATWQAHDEQRNGFATKIRAARYDLTSDEFSPPIRIWQGLSIGPGSLELSAFRGRIFAVYLRGRETHSGLRATVRRIAHS